MRKAAAAGSFYPAYREELEKLVDECFGSAREHTKQVSAFCGVSPHAGLVYSGIAAAATFGSIKELKSAQTVVIAGPNHTGTGRRVSVSTQDWETPLGVFKNDEDFGKEMIRRAGMLEADESAHLAEHSIEVQLPFLHRINPEAKIVPVCMADQGPGAALEVAEAAFGAQEKLGREVVLIASSDFSHYLPAETARKNDKEAIGHIVKLDSAGFQQAVGEKGWSICGYGPITCAIEYAKKSGSKKAVELIYTNSGERSGDFDAVVGYAGIVFER